MFGISHCVHFHCRMNGSDSLEESDRSPMHLCPVCLRKLQSRYVLRVCVYVCVSVCAVVCFSVHDVRTCTSFHVFISFSVSL